MTLLSLRSVSKSFIRGSTVRRVMTDVSLTVEGGRLMSVYGGRGSGKTTLLRVAAALDAPDRGEVRFAGRPLHRMDGRELLALRRRQIAWVDGAGPHDDRMTARDIVALPLQREFAARGARAAASDALAALGIAEHAGEPWRELPDLARILCSIGQALARQPRLLIVDDPTAGLDILARERVCGLLRDAAERDGLAVLMAVPDMPSMLQSHESRVLSRGRLLEPATALGGGPAPAPPVIDLPLRDSA